MVERFHPEGSPELILQITQLLESNGICPPPGDEQAIVMAILRHAPGCEQLLALGKRVAGNPSEYFLNMGGDPLIPSTLMVALKEIMSLSAKTGLFQGGNGPKPTVPVMGAHICCLLEVNDEYSAARLR
jgi:hypothetical protein